MDQNETSEECELCIIGTGISGLNALESASQYLNSTDRVIIVDKQLPGHAIGGMWHNVYRYVRLHQPHPLFTVGKKKWKLKKEASHLATRDEVLEHFQNCYSELTDLLNVEEKFGYLYKGHQEVQENDNYKALIELESTEEPGSVVKIKADRCIKAFGFNVIPNDPLDFETEKVRSIAPESEETFNGAVAGDDKPVYIVGGGKTGMDVATRILAQNPSRKFHFIIGKGMYYMDRDKFFPKGNQRYLKGKSVSDTLIDIYSHYDKDDLTASIEYIKKHYGLSPAAKASQTLFGLLSPNEATEVKASVRGFIYDYLEDIDELDGELLIRYRSGLTTKIPEGSWIINCSGHLYPDRPDETEPIVSPHNTVLSVQKTNSAFFFTSIAGYFLPHLWYRNKFESVPFLYFDHQELIKKDKSVYVFAISAQVIHNQLRCVEALPLKTVMECGLNYDKWFPLIRQMPVLIRLLKNKQRYLDESAEVLTSICSKYGVSYGVIGQEPVPDAVQ